MYGIEMGVQVSRSALSFVSGGLEMGKDSRMVIEWRISEAQDKMKPFAGKPRSEKDIWGSTPQRY